MKKVIIYIVLLLIVLQTINACPCFRRFRSFNCISGEFLLNDYYKVEKTGDTIRMQVETNFEEQRFSSGRRTCIRYRYSINSFARQLKTTVSRFRFNNAVTSIINNPKKFLLFSHTLNDDAYEKQVCKSSLKSYKVLGYIWKDLSTENKYVGNLISIAPKTSTQYEVSAFVEVNYKYPKDYEKPTDTLEIACAQLITIEVPSIVSTGKSNLGNEQNMSVFPSVFSSQVTIKLKNNIMEDGNLKIVNSLGQQVYQNQLPESLNRLLDLTFLKPGNYIVYVEQENKVYSQKIIKQ